MTPGADSPRPIRIMLVDDHGIVRQGLRAYLETFPDLLVVAEAADGKEALDTIARLDAFGEGPDVVLLDTQMPVMDGEQATVEIRRRFPAVKVVVMTSFSNATRIHTMLQAGAAGYVLKRSDTSQIDRAIRAAFAGEVHLDPVVTRQLTQTLVHGEAPSLTVREREVVRLVARGMNNEEIARTLTMSERTARTHVSTILMKLGLESRTQAALWAIREGLVNVE